MVDKVDFRVDSGEIVGLLGPNGAGKTTSFRMTCGMIEANAGQVWLGGVDITNWPMYRRARDGGMGYLAQESSVFRKLTVEQNLLGVMEMLDFDRARRTARCDRIAGTVRHRPAAQVDGPVALRRRAAAVGNRPGLVSNPKIILLDEPFTGIDPVTIISIQNVIKSLRKDDIAILITDHQVRETLQITDRSYVIREGRVLCHGRPDEVLATPRPASIISARTWTWAVIAARRRRISRWWCIAPRHSRVRAPGILETAAAPHCRPPHPPTPAGCSGGNGSAK